MMYDLDKHKHFSDVTRSYESLGLRPGAWLFPLPGSSRRFGIMEMYMQRSPDVSFHTYGDGSLTKKQLMPDGTVACSTVDAPQGWYGCKAKDDRATANGVGNP